MKIITAQQAWEILHSSQCNDGTIFGATFIKRTTGEIRKMQCRRGVTKGVKGVGHSFDPKAKNLICVYDMQKIEAGVSERGAFRMINLEGLQELRLKGATYKVIQPH